MEINQYSDSSPVYIMGQAKPVGYTKGITTKEVKFCDGTEITKMDNDRYWIVAKAVGGNNFASDITGTPDIFLLEDVFKLLTDNEKEEFIYNLDALLKL
jgi:hypothetical protein